MTTEPLQTDEVERHLRICKECGLSHYGSGAHVMIEHDPDNEKSPWRVRCLLEDLPDKPVLARALAFGFALSEWRFSDRSRYILEQSFFGIRASAIRSLELIRILPGVPEDAWICVSILDTDQLDEPRPEPPSPWPPV